ncbi:hypothetical protein AGLY_010247 [Aphis glycines]|uniref:Uncharacterized protein n=1 Tax=Aphis glycines TaxID=307491 RepID=A0A6G0TFV0_APHGL|nr:hypothetical protein AGLY_010247 [Aphis glycines]
MFSFYLYKFSLKCEWNDSYALVVRNNEDDDFAQINRYKKKIMLRIKKGFSEQLLQMALLLSLIGYDRLWPTFGIWPSAPSAEIEVGPLDRWGDDSYSNGFGPLTQIHPKSVDRYLDRQWLLDELLSLGRFGDRYPSNIEAYLLNVDGDENGRDDQQQQDSGGQVVKTEPKENDSEDEDVDRVFDTDIVEDVLMLAPEVSFFICSIFI